MVEEPVGWVWKDTITDGPDIYNAEWIATQFTESGRLNIHGHQFTDDFETIKLEFAINWGVPSIIVINAWDVATPVGITAKADFIF